ETRRSRRRGMRMTHLKKRMTRDHLEADERLGELFQVKEAKTEDGTVVVELTENSTCKTCEV
ncbi:MAG: hypothetical protein GXO15_04480, partial [Crenarchaeota archaeon]|nr:hypothetical protein [Thermoproteota archaeon]